MEIECMNEFSIEILLQLKEIPNLIRAENDFVLISFKYRRERRLSVLTRIIKEMPVATLVLHDDIRKRNATLEILSNHFTIFRSSQSLRNENRYLIVAQSILPLFEPWSHWWYQLYCWIASLWIENTRHFYLKFFFFYPTPNEKQINNREFN